MPLSHFRLASVLRLAVVTAVIALGCAEGEVVETQPTQTSRSSSSAGGAGGGAGGSMGEGGMSPCAQDCSQVATPPCLVSVCNTGQYQGVIGQCVVVPDEAGVSCDDGEFCTIDDTCDGMGQCIGGPENDCGMDPSVCNIITCDEVAQTCSEAPDMNGLACQDPNNLCLQGSTCSNGACVGGTPNDCFFVPVPSDCHMAECNPMNGMCEPVIDPAMEGQTCVFGGDPCMVDKTCQTGMCVGGVPKDCSSLDQGCFNGVCDMTNGNCVTQQVPAGSVCNDGSDQCNTGICDTMQVCVPTPVADGTTCDDFSTCTINDVCTAGACAGAIDPTCDVYFEETFESGCGGWTLNPEWECGVPTNVGPASAYEGTNVLGTDLDSTYENNLTYETCFAETPPISLATAYYPVLSYHHWVHTEGSGFDGYNLKVSTDGGATFSVLTNVNPPYNATVNSQPAWNGNQSAQGWQLVTADMSAYVGQTVIVRWSFRTDSSVVYPGIYVDDIALGEAAAVPLQITTTSLPNAFVASPYSTGISKTGGTPYATWSIVGGTNHGWLSINPATGVLSGTPTVSEAGPVTVTVHVEEPTDPTNFDEATFTFNVQQAVYAETFEGTCPFGWTLSNWQCGTPVNGPMAAYSGSQVIALVLSGTYANNLAYASTTADSPTINLTSATAPQLNFRVWYHTESGFDGFNVKVSTDGGATYSIVTSVAPTYNQTLASEQCWAGNASALGYQVFSANLAAFAGQQIKLRFAFRSDSSVVYPGVFIDDVVVAD